MPCQNRNNSRMPGSTLILTWVGIIFVKILHLAFARCKIMTNIMPTHVKITNIMPTHVKISIEPSIRELFLKQELLDFLGNRIDWLDPCCPYFYFPELWFVSLYCVLCPVSFAKFRLMSCVKSHSWQFSVLCFFYLSSSCVFCT